jgi:hypothetical protein
MIKIGHYYIHKDHYNNPDDTIYYKTVFKILEVNEYEITDEVYTTHENNMSLHKGLKTTLTRQPYEDSFIESKLHNSPLYKILNS